MKLMVFDVGGTEIKYSIMDEQMNRYSEGFVLTPQDNKCNFLKVLHEIYLKYKNEVEGIAMSLPGFIDIEHGIVNGGGMLLYNWRQPIGRELSELCGCPVYMENDGKCAAMAELLAGELKGCRNAAVFIIGTGVGGGLIVNGQIVKGIHFTAGEFSLMQINAHDWENMNETLGKRCSTSALLDRYYEETDLPIEEGFDGRKFFERYHSGDEAASRALNIWGKDVAIQIFNLTVLLDLEKIAIGGGISKQPVVLETIQRCLDEIYQSGPSAFSQFLMPKTQVVSCRFGSEANQVGAVYTYLYLSEKIQQASL